ncbi:MAG: thioredoxin domain-containing protein, partial [Deltaproteobacteria bacterium]|nr:thioredoxin domain-containing protein [Deltaproteobacteria bacterium]
FNIDQERHGLESGILHLRKPLATLAKDAGLPVSDLKTRLEGIRQRLFGLREKRVHPGKDDKILTDWNGLMISAFARAAQALDEPEYARTAARAADFILNNLRAPDGRLLHRYRRNEAAFKSHVDDYAFLIMGLLDLYEAVFEARYLKAALELNQDFLTHFWDHESGGFFYTADDTRDVILRTKEIFDGDMPSGNAVAALNLQRLAHVTGDMSLTEKADLTGREFFEGINRSPSAHTQSMIALEFKLSGPFEVVIAGDPEAEDTREMLKALRTAYIPNKVTLFRPAGEAEPEIAGIAEFTRYQKPLDGKATAYVCQNRACDSPTTDIGQMLESLGHKPKS